LNGLNNSDSYIPFVLKLANYDDFGTESWDSNLKSNHRIPLQRFSNSENTSLSFLPLVLKRTPYDDIRSEALAPNSESFHPLPLLGSWNASTWWNYNTATAGLYPGWQLDMINQGHHLLPWYNIPNPNELCENSEFCYPFEYLESPIMRAAQSNLPISFVGPQWEHYLYDDPVYFNLPPHQNPNVVSTNGSVQKQISPFGPIDYWYEIGEKWGSTDLMQQVISWYPNPPLVIFVSNNEASKLTWKDAETDQHYLDLYGYGRDDNFKRSVFADAWGDRYRALIKGFRDSLENPNWREVSKFIGYEAFGPGWFGRWYGWKEYSLYKPNQIDPNPLYWQGGSPSLYSCPTVCGERDNTVIGPLFQSMNWVFIQNEAYQLNPSFWYEFSSWDGDTESHDEYKKFGQTFTPERYEGFVQFGMWMTRPRIIRVYRDWDQERAEVLPWLMPVMNAIDRIYTNPILRSFWRNSSIIVNPSRIHPYQYEIPSEYSAVDRMFLLSTDLDPPEPWSYQTEFSVLSLTRQKGISPQRQWLLYAYAPLGERRNVSITIPDYGKIIVDISLEGTFYLIEESNHTVTLVTGY
jgi:hypothetical protein